MQVNIREEKINVCEWVITVKRMEMSKENVNRKVGVVSQKEMDNR